MRLRNVKGSRETIAESEFCIHQPEELRGRWSEHFGNDNPIYIEIGMGKGMFIMEMARRNPDINYIGIEKYSSVLVRAIEKLSQEPEITNLVFIRMEAENIGDVFAPGEAAGIYLNFSDPWPKDRHARRRLTSRQFLSRYHEVLRPGANVEFKTDNTDLFEFSLEEAGEAGWTVVMETRDLHHSDMAEGNVMTEYEKKFSEMGNPICKMIITE